MQIALVNGERTLAEKGLRGICTGCGGPVVAKCGLIKVHHWAHETKTSCEYKAMTEWHYAWQNKFPVEMREVKDGPHRADVWDKENGVVYEFQHSSISAEDIEKRHKYWVEKKGQILLWIVDAKPAWEAGRFVPGFREDLVSNVSEKMYGWKHAPSVWRRYQGHICLDKTGTSNYKDLLYVDFWQRGGTMIGSTLTIKKMPEVLSIDTEKEIWWTGY